MGHVFHADAILRGDDSPLLDAAVVLDDARRVVDVGRAADVLPRHAGIAVTRVRGVIAPFLVNAHTHLELTCLRGRVPGGYGFVPWVDKLVATRTEITDEDVDEGVEKAVLELTATATAAVGEVTNGLAAVGALARARIAGVVFHEMFGVLEEPAMKQARALLDAARAKREELKASAPLLRYTPSPHTLYTTHPSVVKALLSAAREAGARATIHLAEHPAERSAIEAGVGPSVDWLKARLRTEPLYFPEKPLFGYARDLGALEDNVLCVHLAIATPEELALVAERRAFVVLCPRSNLYIEARLPPLLAIIDAGIEPALGTDSVASNASLDVLAEARALRDRFPSVSPDALVRMATWNGARALDFPMLGRIAKGAAPGLFAVMGDPGNTPSAFLLANVKAPRTRLAEPNPTS